jgi:hypothetical protein
MLYRSGAEIKSLEQKMAAKKEKVGTESLAVPSNYQIRRTASDEERYLLRDQW